MSVKPHYVHDALANAPKSMCVGDRTAPAIATAHMNDTKSRNSLRSYPKVINHQSSLEGKVRYGSNDGQISQSDLSLYATS